MTESIQNHYYSPVIDVNNFSVAIQKVTFKKELPVESHFLGEVETIWTWGNINPAIGEMIINKKMVFLSIKEASEILQSKIEKMTKILEERKSSTIENVWVAQEVLKEEKIAAKKAAQMHKTHSGKLKNLDVLFELEKRGLSW